MVSFAEVYDRYFKIAFPHLRPQQREILSHLPYSDNPSLVVLSAPPGVGKSLIALIDAVSEAGVSEPVAGAPGHPVVHIVTISKGLQDQYADTLSRITSVNPQWFYTVFKGRQNYKCLLRKGRTAAQCPVLNLAIGTRTFCKYKPGRVPSLADAVDYPVFAPLASGQYLVPPQAEEWCPYWKAKFDALKSNFTVFNYHYYLYELFLVGDFPAPDVLVLDEVHRFFDVMDTLFSVDISLPKLKRMGVDVSSLEGMTRTSFLVEITRALRDRADQLVSQISAFTEDRSDWDPEESRLFGRLLYQYNDVYDTLSRLQVFLRMTPLYFHQFKMYTDGFRFIARPLPRFMSYILATLFANGVKRVLAMSATPGPQPFWDSIHRGVVSLSSRDVGYYYYEYPESPFPPERRLVFMPNDAPVVTERNLKKEIGEYYDLLNTPDAVIPTNVVLRSNIIRSQAALIKSLHDIFGRVLVHTWNNKLAQLLYITLDTMGVSVRFPSLRPTEEIQEWVNSDEESVLLSAAAREGVDLYGDKGRVQVILKYPIPNLRDPYTRAIRTSDRLFYNYQIAANIVQQVGRVCRSADDWGFTIIYDQIARRNILQTTMHYPRYFRRALVTRYNTAQTIEAIARLAMNYMSE